MIETGKTEETEAARFGIRINFISPFKDFLTQDNLRGAGHPGGRGGGDRGRGGGRGGRGRGDFGGPRGGGRGGPPGENRGSYRGGGGGRGS